MLDEDVVKEAISQLTGGISPAAQSDLDSAMQSGRLSKITVGGTTSYHDALSGLPLGAQYDSRSPLGFTIADPNLRDIYSNYQGGLASGVAQNRYDDAFQRDRLKNTLSIMKAADQLDPDLQAIVMERLGIRNPFTQQQGEGGGQSSGGIPTPWGNYQGARRTGAGPNDVEPMFASGAYSGATPFGTPDIRTRRKMMETWFADQLRQPEKAADREVRQSQIAMQGANAKAQDADRNAKIEIARQAVANRELATIKALQEAEEGYRKMGPNKNPQMADLINQQIRMRMQRLNQLNAAMGGGAGEFDPALSVQPGDIEGRRQQVMGMGSPAPQAPTAPRPSGRNDVRRIR